MAYETQTYEAIMQRILERISQSPDKRASSPDWNASAPAALEMAILYTALDGILEATFADTAPRQYLIRRAAERGLIPLPATAAVFRGLFNKAVAIGARFSLGSLNYMVTERMEGDDTPTMTAYRVQCESMGIIGNTGFGALIPIGYIDGLTQAELTELLIPGADEEETEAFRQRYMDSLHSQAFGGNQRDYKEKVLTLPGVGAVKVFPVWNGNLEPTSLVPTAETTAWYHSIIDTLPPAVANWLTKVYTASANALLTVGGTVRLVMMNTAYGIPSEALLADVQEAIDPPMGHGEGLGFAPIGHVVRVDGVESMEIHVALKLTYQPDWNWQAVESYVQAAIDDYFAELAKDWQSTDNIVVRIAQIETRVLTCPGIVDVKDTTLNGNPDNVVLDGVHIPIRGAISG